MIGISKLYCGTVEPSDPLRYGRDSGKLPSHLLQFSKDKKPVVVWNVTQRCNLACVHCYSHSTGKRSEEMTTEQGFSLLEDLAQFGSPVILFSGGEPLSRPDLMELIQKATSLGMRAVISTNGTLIDEKVAGKLKTMGLSYVGISIDGLQATNDKFRRVDGAFDKAINGIRACHAAGVKVGLRFTITRHNGNEVDGLFDLLEKEKVPRICFYHLVYAGRGAAIAKDDLHGPEARNVIDRIIDRTAGLHERGVPTEVLTVDNHCDGAYLYLRLLREDPEKAKNVLELLRMNGGDSTGVGIGCVSWNGDVHPNQFWRHEVLGNVLETPFSKIWTSDENELLVKLRDKAANVGGRCASCRFLDCCAGASRVRAEAIYGDVWAQEPACYLTDEEIKGEG